MYIAFYRSQQNFCGAFFFFGISGSTCCLPPVIIVYFFLFDIRSETATDFFITRALFTTWGRNIFPLPNRSPTTFIPAISGPSITSSGLSIFLPGFFRIRFDIIR